MYQNTTLAKDRSNAGLTDPSTVMRGQRNLAFFGTWGTAQLDIEILVNTDSVLGNTWLVRQTVTGVGIVSLVDLDVGTVFRVNFRDVSGGPSISITHGPFELG